MATSNQSSEKPSAFVPKGAIAFFATMVLFFAAVWLGFYIVMIRRHGGP